MACAACDGARGQQESQRTVRERSRPIASAMLQARRAGCRLQAAEPNGPRQSVRAAAVVSTPPPTTSQMADAAP